MSKQEKQATYFRALFGSDLTEEEKRQYNESIQAHYENMIRFQSRARYDQTENAATAATVTA